MLPTMPTELGPDRRQEADGAPDFASQRLRLIWNNVAWIGVQPTYTVVGAEASGVKSCRPAT